MSGPTVGEVLDAACAALAGRVDAPRREAEYLLAETLGVSRARLAVEPERRVPEPVAREYAERVRRRADGVPVAYLLGRRAFWTLELEVTPDVLVPRHETELLVELALARLAGRTNPAILDLGTGSGAIGLALAAERPDARVTLVDASAAALAVAERNRARLGYAHIECRLGEWYAPVAGRRFAAIVANPPYLAEGDPHLGGHELPHEPRGALVSGPTGLEALAAVIDDAPAHLEHDGWLLVEHGAAQGADVRDAYARAGFVEVATARDLAGLERATMGRHARATP